MSYILEALKKSDQQRQRSAAPTLPAATVAVEATRKPVYYGLLAVVLLGAGIAIGWLRPWQAELPAPEAKYSAAKASIQVSQQAAPTPLYSSSEMAGKTVQQSPTPNLTQQPAARVAAMQAAAPVRTGKPGAAAPVPPENPADAPQQAIPVTELPVSIQQEIPAMTIQFHAYSSIPANRLVSINSLMLHEGESLMPGLKLEQITVEGMIFSYKGYRFQRGIR
ncbi:MAG: general secretion pathway protein GspB [Gallionella sp.]|nr:general secretion pathway protein GspB [Gallionella sp.]